MASFKHGDEKQWSINFSSLVSQVKPEKPSVHVHLNKVSETTEHLPLFKHGIDEHESSKTLITIRVLFYFLFIKD